MKQIIICVILYYIFNTYITLKYIKPYLKNREMEGKE